MTVRLDGLQSGMDTTGLIQSMLEAQRVPFIRKENEIYNNELKLNAWSQLDTKLTDLNSKAVQLNTYTTWQQKKASSDDEDIVTASASKDAAKGSYSIDVTQLAKNHRIASDAQSSATVDLNLTGDFTLGGQTITVTATDSLEDIRDAINTAANDMTADNKVNASIIGNTLVLERDKTGATDISISDGTNNVLQSLGVFDGAAAVKNELQASQDLAASINGVDVSSSENTGITSFVEDVTFNFYDTGTTTVDVKNDTGTIKQLIKDFISSYNDAMELAETASAVSLDNNDENIESLGILQGDVLINEIRNRSRQIMTSLESNPNYLDQDFNTMQKVGIWTTGRDNRLAITDEEALDDALENHFDELEDLFRDYDSGVIRNMVDYTDNLIAPIEGQVVRRQTNLETQNDRLEKQIQDFEDSIPDKEAELYEQFARMETQLAEIQSQAGYVLSNLGIKK